MIVVDTAAVAFMQIAMYGTGMRMILTSDNLISYSYQNRKSCTESYVF